ncbi:MAG: hypothetical protein AAGF11_56665 [Myxococcota bacterium]
MRFACRWVVGCGALALAGCFDPQEPLDTDSTEDSGSGTTSSTPPTTGSPTTADPTASDPDATATDDPTTEDPDTTTDPPECDGNGLDPSCPSEAPFCADGACVDCTSLAADACQTVDPATPVCDAGTSTCVACTEHDQCGSGACRFTTGECFAQSNRLFVDNTFGGCAGGVGTEANPFCTVVEAMEVLNNQAGTEPWAIFVAGSPNEYEGTVDPGNNRPVAIIGPSEGLAATLLSQDGFTVDLWAQSPETYLDHLTIERNFGGTTVRCNTGQVYVTDSNLRGGDSTVELTGCSMRTRRVTVSSLGMGMIVESGGELRADQTIFDNSSGGLRVEGTAVLNRSVVSNNYVEGGISVVGGDLTLTNSMVFQNQYQNDGVFVSAGGTAEVVHSTIVGAFSCGQMEGATTIRNSIVLPQVSAGMDCSTTTIDNSVVNDGVNLGMGNVMASEGDLGVIFVDPVPNRGGDWHVLPGSLPEGVAVHQAGDPVVDFDGDPRPVMAGASDYAGADVP